MSVQLHLETTGFCNGACHFCIYRSKENEAQPKGFMPWDLFTKIIDEAATIPQIDSIAWSGLAEPLTDPKLIERVAYAKNARFSWFQEMYTNGVFLTPEKFDALREAGMDHVSISLNAVNQEQHEKIMGIKGKFQTVCDNADYARTHTVSPTDPERKCNIQVKAVINGDQFTMDDHFWFLARWGTAKDGKGHGQAVTEMNWADQNRTIREFDPNSCCRLRALGQLSVHWDGRVNLCCLDPMGKYPWGDLKTQTIREIYNAPAYVQFREDHFNDQAAKHPMCAVCTRV